MTDRRGERNGRARLRAADVVEIRRAAVFEPARAIAERYGVTAEAVRFVALRKTWASVPEAPGVDREAAVAAYREAAACRGRETRAGGSRGPKPTAVHGYARKGEPRTSIYSLWRDLRRRYPEEVGGRWRESFPNFLADVGDRPPGEVLVRLDERRAWGPGNVAWTTASQSGPRNPAARLDGMKVHRVRSYLERGFSRREVAEIFGLSRSHVGRIARGESWRDVT